ncbi:cohesin domain-containing protein [Ideonella paludis]|uniref:cohesin domain-containing protein n=1 Tax=Ideonella paludis TaxID=1233411 RepID=UPI00363B1355
MAPTVNPLTLSWRAPAEAKVGEVFELSLMLNSLTTLRGAPVTLAYNKAMVEVVGVEEGDYFRQGGQKTHFTHQTDAAAGRVQAGVLRETLQGTPGQGSVLTLKLKALAPGVAEFHLASFDGVVVGVAPVASPRLAPHKLQVKAP